MADDAAGDLPRWVQLFGLVLVLLALLFLALLLIGGHTPGVHAP
jgi:hypothetical protein